MALGPIADVHDLNLYAQLVGGDELEEQGFVLAVSLEQLDARAEAADAVIGEVGTLLSPSRTLISDRSWEERRIAGLVRVNNLDDRGPWDAFEWAQANVSRQRSAFA